MARTVESFIITRSADNYLLQIEDEEGETLEFEVTYDQMELIGEDIERHLDEDEEDALVVDQDEEDLDEEEDEA